MRHRRAGAHQDARHLLGADEERAERDDQRLAQRIGENGARLLQRAAEALGCRLVYAFVPDVSFDELVRQQATGMANSEIARVDQTMLLEGQRVDLDIVQRRAAERAEELIGSRRLWDRLPSHLE